MSTPYQQDTRIGELSTPLGKDRLVLVDFSGSEGMSELFRFDISAICDEQDGGPLNFDDALGQSCTVRLATPKGEPRYFCGTLVEAEREGPVTGGVLYRLVLRPWFWMLTQRVNSHVFHDVTPEEIIEQVLGKHGFADFENRASASGVTLEYCVQHRESDYAFVCRLLERHGIAYHFVFGDNKQTMVLTNDRSGYGKAPDETRRFHPNDRGRHDDEETLNSWVSQRRFVSGKVVLNDYDYKNSNSDLIAEKLGGAGYSNAELEVYGHPGQFLKQGDGNTYATVATDALQAQDAHFIAEGNCFGLAAGLTFQLKEHPDAGEYLVLGARHALSNEGYRSGQAYEAQPYRGRYELVKADRTFAPPQITPRPYITGPQTAKVITEPGEDPDRYGRVKVRFDWHKSQSEGESMFCRVAQVWVGRQWGAQFIPRTGMEALIQFIDGDPDRPVIIGTVPNDEYQLPYSDEEYTSGWKTMSDNEIKFVDKPGSELVRMYGIRDIEIEAEHQITLRVGGSTIVIDQTSITMKSTTITAEASSSLTTESKGNALHKAGADLTTESTGTANHKASAVMVIRGSLVKIN